MTPPNRNLLWAGAVAEELERCGLHEVCLSPGSRSAPLALALHARSGLRVTTHLDERSAAYFALGASKATGTPAVIVCTSGTAAANYYPAVVEAAESQTPLVVLTADRPPELQGVGANQAIDQQRLYGSFPRFFADAGLPEPRPESVRHLRSLVCRAVAASRGPFPGPVHLNFPFRDPLDPTPVAGDVPSDWEQRDPLAARGRGDQTPYLDIPPSHPTVEAGALEAYQQRLARSRRTLLVAGPGTGATEALELSARLQAPILCDPLSGLRFGPSAGAQRIATYDAWLSDPRLREDLRPDLVVRLGAAPTSKHLLNALTAWDCPQVLVDPTNRRAEPTHRADLVLNTTAESACQHALRAPTAPSSADYAALLRRVEREALRLHRERLPASTLEGALVAQIAASLPPEATLWIGSSLPVRDLDRFAAPREAPLRVLANRGASGIDGVLSSALGAALAGSSRTVLVLGDVSFLHDLSGAVTAARLGIRLDVVVLDNDGGGIFEFLPISRHEPPFTELFVTPHGRDLAAIAASIGWRVEPAALPEAASRLQSPADGPRLIHVRTDRKRNLLERRRLEEDLHSVLAPLVPARPR